MDAFDHRGGREGGVVVLVVVAESGDEDGREGGGGGEILGYLCRVALISEQPQGPL